MHPIETNLRKAIYLCILASFLCLGIDHSKAATNLTKQGALSSYEALLTRHLAKFQEYPDSAKLYGLEGDAIIKLHVNQSGEILDYTIVKSVEHQILMDAIHEMLKNANPVPPIPTNYLGKETEAAFMFPVAFRIKKHKGYLKEIDQRFQQEVKKAWQNSK